MEKKLTCSVTDKKIFGVCGGIAEYFGIDSTLVRIAWVIASLLFGCGVLAYLLCALIIPKAPKPEKVEAKIKESNENTDKKENFDGSNEK